MGLKRPLAVFFVCGSFGKKNTLLGNLRGILKGVRVEVMRSKTFFLLLWAEFYSIDPDNFDKISLIVPIMSMKGASLRGLWGPRMSFEAMQGGFLGRLCTALTLRC